MLKTLFKNAGAASFGFLRPQGRRRLVQPGLYTASRRAPRDAMRELLEIETDLARQIDVVALRYDGGVHVKHRLMQYHEFFVKRVGQEDRVLDIGCGYGAVAFSIASRAGADVVGLDSSHGNIDQAKRLFSHPRLTFLRGHAPEDMPTGPFDVVVMSNVLEHIDDRRGFIQTVQQRLGPRRWLLRVPMIDRHWYVPLRRELGLFHFSDPTHFTEYTRASFEAEMAETGLSIDHLQVNWGEIWAEVHA